LPVKKVKCTELSQAAKQYNLIVRGIHAVAERANSLLKTTFKALRSVSVCPWRIGAIAKAALVLLHLEYNRPCQPVTHRDDSCRNRSHLRPLSAGVVVERIGSWSRRASLRFEIAKAKPTFYLMPSEPQ